MSSSRSSSRYNSFDNRSSTQSNPSSSTDINRPRTLAKSRSTRNDQNLSAMAKKFMASSTMPKPRDFVVPTLLADDLKKKTGITTGFKKLFASKLGKLDDEKKKKKALPEARTLATVLRSERELLSQNKDQETEILHLNSMLQEKNREVDKLKDLCLKQREEIKALKSAILFPAEQEVIPTLQRQVTSLTSQLLYLAQDLAEVKADKYSASPRTPTHEQEEATNSVEFSSADPGSPDDMFFNDLNPCLTPYANSKSKEHSSSYNNNNNNNSYITTSFSDGKILGRCKQQNILTHC